LFGLPAQTPGEKPRKPFGQLFRLIFFILKNRSLISEAAIYTFLKGIANLHIFNAAQNFSLKKNRAVLSPQC